LALVAKPKSPGSHVTPRLSRLPAAAAAQKKLSLTELLRAPQYHQNPMRVLGLDQEQIMVLRKVGQIQKAPKKSVPQTKEIDVFRSQRFGRESVCDMRFGEVQRHSFSSSHSNSFTSVFPMVDLIY
jgi:hypothetical protein